MTDVSIGKFIRIRDCGYDENWLQDQIANNPSCLQLGDLELLDRERKQSSGGRLDILLKDQQDDTMYEVEVMLDETDETHIIRTIEYWIREKRKFPQRQHYPVLIAENITRRFFDVIQVLSHAIPMIAIQVCVIEANNNRSLSFHKILDVYEEPEDSDSVVYEPHDEVYWLEKASWTNDTAKSLLIILKPIFEKAELNYVKNYIAVLVNRNNYFQFYSRATSKSMLKFWIGEHLINAVKTLLDTKEISYSTQKNHTIIIWLNKKSLEDNAEVYLELGKLVKEAWTS